MKRSGGSARSTVRRKRRRLQPEARRARLLEVGVQVFAHRGLTGGAHAEIARREGVAVSTAFAYFPTREELRDAVLEEVAKHYLEIARRVHRDEVPADEVIADHLEAIVKAFRESPDETLVWLQWSTAYRSEVWRRYERHQADALKLIGRTLARGRREGTIDPELDTGAAARMLVGSATMLAEMVLVGRSEAEVSRFVSTLLRAIRPRPVAPS